MDLGPLPPIGPPRPPEPPSGRRATLRQAAIAIGLVLIVAVVVIVANREHAPAKAKAAAAPVGTSYDGAVYIETNDRRKNANSVLAYRYKNGSFRPLSVHEYLTGGGGSHHPSEPRGPHAGRDICDQRG